MFTIVEKKTPWGTRAYGQDYGVLAQARARNGGKIEIADRAIAEEICKELVEEVDACFREALAAQESETRQRSMGAPDRYVVVEVKAGGRPDALIAKLADEMRGDLIIDDVA